MPSGNWKNRGSGLPPARPESVIGARLLSTRPTRYTAWPGVPGAPITANTLPEGRSPKSAVMVVKDAELVTGPVTAKSAAPSRPNCATGWAKSASG